MLCTAIRLLQKELGWPRYGLAIEYRMAGRAGRSIERQGMVFVSQLQQDSPLGVLEVLINVEQIY